MPGHVSIYLDAVRFLAAFGVFLHHLASPPFSSGVIPGWIAAYGQICVTIFFVLSGYVIAFVCGTREKRAAEYFASRASRLYSVVLPALALTFLLDQAGMFLNPELYALQKVLWKPESLGGYLSSLFFVNEYQIFQFDGIAPGTNGPYWSISFEATYYLIAGLVLFLPGSLAIPVSAALLFAAGRTISALLPLWLLGFGLYPLSGRIRIAFFPQLVLFVLSSAVIVSMPWLTPHLFPDNLGVYFPWGRKPFNRAILADYVTGLAFAANIISAHGVFRLRARILERAAPYVRWLSSLTFPLYCMHYPAICFFRAVSPARQDSVYNVLFIFLCVAVLVIALTPATERLKNLIRTKILLIYKRT